MKFLGKLFSKVAGGAVFGFIKQYSQIIFAVLLIGFGIHYSTLRHNKKKYKELYELSQFKNNELLTQITAKSDTIRIVKSKASIDSLEFENRVVEFQKVILEVQKKTKQRDETIKQKDTYILELESGLLCKTIKIGLFGKRTTTIEKCEE